MDVLKVLVGSEARASVLAAFYAEPERRYYQAELARSTGLALAAVQRELTRLTNAGLVRRERIAGRELYTADPKAAIHADLRRIVLKTRGVAGRLAQALAEQKGVELAWIFGSFATDLATATSDVDVFVLGAASPRDVRRVVGRVERDIQRTVNENVMPASEWTRRLGHKDGFIREVRRGLKMWIRGSDQELKRLDASRAPT